MINSILALDLGTKTGWSLRKNNGDIFSGVLNFKETRFSGCGMKFLKFKDFLDKHKDIDVVYFEEVRRHIGTDAAHVYGGFWAHLVAWCEENEKPYLGVGVKVIKKFITGSGNAKKDDVVKAINSRGFNVSDDNEADSIAVLLFALNDRNINVHGNVICK